jgi:hypothetical protein
LPDAAAATDGGVLSPNLPNLADLPASLYVPPPQRTTRPMSMTPPYFEQDPLLDLPEFPPVGWFAGAEVQIVKPHLVSRLSETVQNPAQKAANTSTTVALPSTSFDWTASPRFVLGYRLPSGFGEFSVAYRFLDQTGTGTTKGPDGPAGLNSRLSFNIIDLDYGNSEVSGWLACWPQLDMTWSVGARFLTLFYDTTASQPFNQAAGGSGILQARDSSNLNFGAGPHAMLDLAHRLGDSGLALRLRTDFSTVFSTGYDNFSTLSTTLGANGRPLRGQTSDFFHQGTSIINIQTGITWQPLRNQAVRLFLGYQYERWFALEQVVDSGSHGQLWDQGAVLQATIRY